VKHVILRLGSAGVEFCQRLTRATIFFFMVLFRFPRFGTIWSSLSKQLFNVGVLSLVIILLSALFIGMVVALQGYNTLTKFGADQELGQLLALSVFRELSPVVSALLFAGRAGSALTAELGLMSATEQISSMEMMAVDPLAHVVAPRLWAGFISLPILVILFDITAVFGGTMVGVDWLGVDRGAFWSNMQSAVNFQADILSGVIKGMVFAVVISWLALYQGFYCDPNARGISRATTRTVVYSSLLVLALDFVLTTMMMGGW
jgi:phospholipid/cholesterol/gamma-HCH transport system permease protein